MEKNNMASCILLTGDTHGSHSIRKLSSKKFNYNELGLTKNDYLIITGDFGLIWHKKDSPYDKEDQYWLRWLDEKPWTTLFVDGNHCNFDRLNTEFPVEEWHNGKVHRINDSICHLMRGQVFDIGGKSFFTMGSAYSHDIEYRIPHQSWWPQEVASFCEREEAIANLAAHNNKVDYIITHDAPENVARRLIRYSGDWSRRLDEYEKWLQENIADKVEFKTWFHGHHHMDLDLGLYGEPKYRSLYYDIGKLTDDGFEVLN